VRVQAPEVELIGVFDCKYFNRSVDVTVIDSLVGFMEDIGAESGGIVTSMGFSESAANRALSSKQKIVSSVFRGPEALVDDFAPSLDFSNPRNSMYLALL